jgi:hypothetical protein
LISALGLILPGLTSAAVVPAPMRSPTKPAHVSLRHPSVALRGCHRSYMLKLLSLGYIKSTDVDLILLRPARRNQNAPRRKSLSVFISVEHILICPLTHSTLSHATFSLSIQSCWSKAPPHVMRSPNFPSFFFN